MAAFTVRYRPIPGTQLRTALDTAARGVRATVSWTDAPRYDRSYALVEGASDREGLVLSTESATVFDTPVIALAIRPNAAEALPALHDLLAGPGRPSGVLGAEAAPDAVLVEWNLDVTPAQVLLALVDIELARCGASRVTELLTPLPLAWWTAIARDGLQAPEIAPDRVLEALIEEQHVVP